MKTLRKMLDHVIYTLKKEHVHEEPVPAIFKDRSLVWNKVKQ